MNIAVKELSKSEINHIKKKAEYEGKIFKTNNYGDVVVLEYISSRDITIRFINTGNIRKVGASELKKGEVRDNELKPVYKVGIMDIPNAVGTRDHPKSYVKWDAMLQRCYNENIRSKHTTYSDCEVSDDFKYYSKFKEWFENQIGSNQEGWHLDKDILVKGNKVYSEDTCCFVPNEINCALVTSGSRRGDMPQGITWNCTKTRYRARIQRGNVWESLGTYDTPEEAFAVYKPIKEAHIKSLADKYKDVIDPRVYEALYKWTINIDD